MSFYLHKLLLKPPDSISINCSDNYLQRTNDINKSNRNGVSQEKCNNDGATKGVIIIGNSMLKNFNGGGLSKSKNVEVMNFPGAINIVHKIF